MSTNTLFSIVITFLCGMGISAQEKKKFTHTEQVLSRIIPDSNVEHWVLMHSSYGKARTVKTYGKSQQYLPQFSGFNLSPAENSFYYIAYSDGGNITYVQNLEALKNFIGKTDNAEEAALKAVFEGYFIDEEYVEVAANYTEDSKNYYLELGKITATECPFQKSHFLLTVDKKSGDIKESKNNGPYMELYNKKCTNNPRLLKLEKKEEPAAEETKKKTSTKKNK